MRCALSYWSQNSGSTTIGLPKYSASVTVLLPPCVITRSTCGRIDVCGRNSAPVMLAASVIWSCCGPLDAITRRGRELGAGHVVGERDLGVLRPRGRGQAMGAAGRRPAPLLHQLDGARPESAQ